MMKWINYVMALFCATGTLFCVVIGISDIVLGNYGWAAAYAALMPICGFAACLWWRDARRMEA